MDNTALPSNTKMSRAHDMFDDFMWGAISTDGPTGILSAVKNGGTAAQEDTAPSDNGYMGLLNISTGTSSNSTGKSLYKSSQGVFKIKSGGNTTVEWRMRIPVLSGTPSFNIKIGMHDGNHDVLGDPANGIYFYYSDTVNSGKWRAVTRNASISTNIESNVTVAANIWYKLKIIINSGGTEVNFYINETLVGTSTTNIPSNNGVAIIASVEKQGASSSTSRTINLDWLYFRTER